MSEFLTIRNFIPKLTIAQRFPWVVNVGTYVIMALLVAYIAYCMGKWVCCSIKDAEDFREIMEKYGGS